MPKKKVVTYATKDMKYFENCIYQGEKEEVLAQVKQDFINNAIIRGYQRVDMEDNVTILYRSMIDFITIDILEVA